MSTDNTNQTTPKTAAQAWAAIHKACGNAVRAQLEDDDVDGAIWYAEKMESVKARFPADHPIHFTETKFDPELCLELSDTEKLAMGYKDHEIIRYTSKAEGDFEFRQYFRENGMPLGRQLLHRKQKRAKIEAGLRSAGFL